MNQLQIKTFSTMDLPNPRFDNEINEWFKEMNGKIEIKKTKIRTVAIKNEKFISTRIGIVIVYHYTLIS